MQLAGREERGLRALLRPRKRHVTAPEPFDPELLPEDPADAVEASLELFNESTHPRPFWASPARWGSQAERGAASHREVVVTVAWDLSWYQYRVDMLGVQTVTLQRRGEELTELDGRFLERDAQAEPDGTVALAS